MIDPTSLFHSVTSLKTILIFVFKKKKKKMQSSSYSQFQNTCICTQNSVFYLVKMEVSILIPKAILPTSSLYSSLVSFSRTSVQQISVLFLTSISPSPWSFPSGISIAHYHPLKQSSLNLVLLWLIALLLLRAKSSQSIIDFTVSASSLSFLNLLQASTPLKQLLPI